MRLQKILYDKSQKRGVDNFWPEESDLRRLHLYGIGAEVSCDKM